MKKTAIYLLFTLFTLTSMAQTTADNPNKDNKLEQTTKKAKKQKVRKEKKAPQEDIVEGKVPGKVYVCGCSFELGDTVAYISEIIEVDSLTITKKNKFLPYRSDFSQQFKDKLEGASYRLTNQTASVFYSDQKVKLEKEMARVKKRLLTKQKMSIVVVPKDIFKFVHPLDYYGAPVEE